MADAGQQKKRIPSSWFVIAVVVIMGGVYFWKHYEIRLDNERGLIVNGRNENKAPGDDSQSKPSVEAAAGGALQVIVPPNEVPPLTTMTIATWDLSPLSFEKLSDETRARRIAEVIADFDLIAIQGIDRTTQPLDEIIRRINATGKSYAYAIPKNIGNVPEYVAFIFDTKTVKYDPAKTRDVVEPTLSYRPLVAAFSTVQPPPEKAFTFYLINVKIPADRRDIESRVLGRIFRQVRDEDPDEDDVIMLGNFGQPVRQIDSLRNIPYLAIVHNDLPTTIDGLGSTQNIVFDNQRTVEGIGNAKLVDLIKRFDLKLSEAAAIAEHLPICAEFSVFEALSLRPNHVP